MNTKLTLKLDSEIIGKAKSYAKDHNSSLSKLIETFLNNLTRNIKDFKHSTLTVLSPKEYLSIKSN